MVGSRGFNTDSHVSRLAERTACYLPKWIRSRGGGWRKPRSSVRSEICHTGMMRPWGQAVAPLRGRSSPSWGLREETQAETET